MRAYGLILLLAVTLSLAACGGGGDHGGHKDYKGQALAIAQRIAADSRGADAKIKAATTAAELVKQLDAYEGRLDAAATDLRGLDPPARLRADHDALVRDVSNLSDFLRELGDAVKTKDSARVKALAARLTPLGEAARASTEKLQRDLGA
jgi:hypothetical protein